MWWHVGGGKTDKKGRSIRIRIETEKAFFHYEKYKKIKKEDPLE